MKSVTVRPATSEIATHDRNDAIDNSKKGPDIWLPGRSAASEKLNVVVQLQLILFRTKSLIQTSCNGLSIYRN